MSSPTTEQRPARVEHDGSLATIVIDHPLNLFGDLRNAVQSFLTDGPGKAKFKGR